LTTFILISTVVYQASKLNLLKLIIWFILLYKGVVHWMIRAMAFCVNRSNVMFCTFQVKFDGVGLSFYILLSNAEMWWTIKQFFCVNQLIYLIVHINNDFRFFWVSHNGKLCEWYLLVGSDHHQNHGLALLMPIGSSVIFCVHVQRTRWYFMFSWRFKIVLCCCVFWIPEEWSWGLLCVKIVVYWALLSNSCADSVANMQYC